MLYLVEVVGENYKVYDSSTEDVFMVDVKYLESNAVLGVAQLTDVSILAQCMSKLQAEIVNCFASIKGYKCKYTFDCYADMLAEVCIRKSVIDIIADSYSKPDENVTLEGNRLEIIGRAIATYKFVFIIRNREKFDKLITKYCIMRGKND